MKSIGKAALAAIVFIAATCAAAYAYEFTLLNGMKLKGSLSSFSDGRFYVNTDFGQVVVDADKLDYIIVEEADPGPAAKGGSTGGPGICMAQQSAPDRVSPLQIPECPKPLASHSVPPAPLSGRSVPPAPLGTWSIGDFGGYPGQFRGAK